MSEEHKKEDQRDAGLVAVALADAGQRTALEKGLEVATDEQATPLFAPDEAKAFRARWNAIQVGFVDEPRRAVEQADSLVAETMKRLAEVFVDERARLDNEWGHDETVSTENLRLALRRYRSFFGRLLSV